MFKNRIEAGKKIAQKLISYKNNKNILILGLPRGGIILANEIAKIINSQLDIIVPRKIGSPYDPEFAIGAITEEGEAFLNKDIINNYNISKEYIDKEIIKEKKEAKRRLKIYRGNKKLIDYKDKIIILVDDGIATGSTILAAIFSIKKFKPKKIIVAVPVLSRDIINIIKKEVDKLIYLEAPFFFEAIGSFYEEFEQTSDKEVKDIMKNYIVLK